MKVDIKTRKGVSSHGEPGRRITKISLPVKDDLPGVFLDCPLCIYRERLMRGDTVGEMALVKGESGLATTLFAEGDFLEEEYFQECLETIEKALVNFKEMKENLLLLKTDWTGEEVFSF